MPTPLTHTTLQKLIKKFLKSLDSYNADDLTLSDTDTDRDTLGDRASICLNQALHIIYDLIKDSKYLEAYPTTAFYTVSGQDFIDLDPEAFLDDIEAITDSTNDRKLIRKTWQWYRRNYPDPSQTTGDPVFYIRRNNRIYLAPRPSSVINYVIDFRKLTNDLELNNDLPLIPSHYDYWTIAEAKVIWHEMEDPSNVPALIVAERDSKRQTALESVFSTYDHIFQAGSNCERQNIEILPYRRPIPS